MNAKRYASLTVLMAAIAASAYAFGESSVLPGNVRSVDPRPDSRVNVGPFSSPLGLQQISVMFSNDVTVNKECTAQAHIYKEGDETPLQSVGISGVTTDIMQKKIGELLFP